MANEFLIRQFALKAKSNAEAAVDSVFQTSERRGEYGDAATPIVAFQLSQQLVTEGLELILKSLCLLNGVTPPPKHSLPVLLGRLRDPERKLVERVVKSAIEESSTGSIPYDLPNIAAVMLLEHVKLGEERLVGALDPMRNYSKMDATRFFSAIYQEWQAERSQYLGANPKFETRGSLRVNTRVLAGAVLVCNELANDVITRLDARKGR